VAFELSKLVAWLVHDLLQISELSDLVYVGWELLPLSTRLWVERSLQEAPFVVVRRANLFDGMVPVGVCGSLRKQRFDTYLAPESIRNRITPEQLTPARGWLANARAEEIPALKVLAGLEEELPDFPLTYGPIGSIGFELASGLPIATSTSDLDLLIRATERVSMQLARHGKFNGAHRVSSIEERTSGAAERCNTDQWQNGGGTDRCPNLHRRLGARFSGQSWPGGRTGPKSGFGES
jgi:phosphoribosyl-dephospho-CoA transferase